MLKVNCTSVTFNFLLLTSMKVFNRKIFSSLKFKKNPNYKIILKLQRKLKKYNIVTLRAPKHFKKGRNHYQMIRRRFDLNFIFIKKINKTLKNIKAVSSFVKCVVSFIDRKVPSIQFSSKKSCICKTTLFFSFKIIYRCFF